MSGCQYPNVCYGPPDFSTPVPTGEWVTADASKPFSAGVSDDGWVGTLFIVGIGALVGFGALAALAEADKCPKLRVRYNRALRSTGLERELADSILSSATSAGCAWTRRFPFTVWERA